MEQQELEQRIVQLEATVNALVTQFLPPVTERLAALERIVRVIKPEGTEGEEKPATEPRKRSALSYRMYQMVKLLHEQGAPVKEIVSRCDLPYTTVRAYINLSPERVEQLRQKQEKKDAEVAERALRAMRKQAKEMGNDMPVPPPPAGADADVDAPAGVVVGTVDPKTPREEAYVAAQNQSVLSAEGTLANPTVAAEPVPTEAVAEDSYQVECPRSMEPYGSAGWYDWTHELRTFAQSHQFPDGFPRFYPVDRGTLVYVQYMNEQVEPTPVAAGAVDWAFSVLRWKLA